MATYPDEYTKILLHFNGIDGSQTIVEVGDKSFTANANAQLDTDQKKFGLSSLLLDGFDDYISTPNHSDFAIGMSEFAIDCHVRFDSLPASYQLDYVCGHGNAGENRWGFYVYNNGVKYDVYFVVYEEDNLVLTVGATGLTLAVDTWYHFALTATTEGSGRRFRIFQDGQIRVSGGGTFSTVSIPTITGPFRIGTQYGAENFLNAWMDEFRFSVGTNRWADNFTVPTAEYYYTADFTDAPLLMTLAAEIAVDPCLATFSISDFLINEYAFDFSSAPLSCLGSVISDEPFFPVYGQIDFSLFDVSGYGRATLFAGDIRFPLFNVSGVALAGNLGRGDIRFPTFIVTGRFGLRGAIVFPLMEVSGQGKTGRVLYGNIIFPHLIVSGQGTTTRGGIGIIDFPIFIVQGSGTQHFFGNGAIDFKPFRVLGFASAGYLGSGQIFFPLPIISGKAYFIAEGEGSIIFPTFVVNGYARAAVRDRLAIVMNINNKAVTKYLNYGFNSFANVNGVFYGANDSGIWKLDGSKDNGSNIESRVLTGIFDFWINGKKKPREIWATMRADGRMILEVVINENDIWEDEFNYFLEQIEEAKSTFAKGIKDRFLAFGVKNKDGADFEIDSVRILVDKLGKVR